MPQANCQRGNGSPLSVPAPCAAAEARRAGRRRSRQGRRRRVGGARATSCRARLGSPLPARSGQEVTGREQRDVVSARRGCVGQDGARGSDSGKEAGQHRLRHRGDHRPAAQRPVAIDCGGAPMVRRRRGARRGGSGRASTPPTPRARCSASATSTRPAGLELLCTKPGDGLARRRTGRRSPSRRPSPSRARTSGRRVDPRQPGPAPRGPGPPHRARATTSTTSPCPPTAAHVVYVRSPLAYARIEAIDADEARAAPGVLAVVTAADLDLADLEPEMMFLNLAMKRPLLARDVVRFVGEPVVAVVAETRAQAVDAAEQVIIDYDPLDPVVDPEQAREHGATLFPDAESPLAMEIRRRLRGRLRRLRGRRRAAHRQPAGGRRPHRAPGAPRAGGRTAA